MDVDLKKSINIDRTKNVILSIAYLLAWLGALFSIALGIIVIIGWYTHNASLIQILPELVPMQYNTALGFILSGIGLILILLNRYRYAAIFGVLVGLLGIVTLFEYATTVNLGIDEFFMKHYITVETSNPGRMAPNTALCFLLVGLTLLWSCVKQKPNRKAFIMCLVSFIVAILGAVSFFGYLTEFATLNRWGAMTNMAWHTAFGFMVWGLASVIALIVRTSRKGIQSNYFQILATFFFSMLVFIVIWQLLIFHEAKTIRQLMRNTADEIAKEYVYKIDSEYKAMLRFADRWLMQKGIAESYWKQDVSNYLDHHDAIYLIGWINPDMKLERYLTKNNQTININTDIRQNKKILELMKSTAVKKSAALKGPIEIDQKKYFVSFIPLVKGNYSDGCIIVLYDIKNLSESVLSNEVFDNYNLNVYAGNKLVFTNDDQRSMLLKNNWAMQMNPQVQGENLHFEIWPSWQLLDEYRSIAPLITLLVGLIFSALLTTMVNVRKSLILSRKEFRQSNKDLESFSYSISHDLRAPLRHMVGFIDLLNKKPDPNLSESTQRYLKFIAESAEQMGVLIDGVLMLSRIGRRELEKTFFSLEKLVDQVKKELAPEYKDRNIVWDISNLPEIYADKDLFKLVIQNLLSNAIKFTREREDAMIIITCESQQNMDIISVSDNGVGFKQVYVDKVFGLFQRLHKESEFEGSGIGLANVEKIVSRHEGKIWAKAELGEGATFYVAIPKRNK